MKPNSTPPCEAQLTVMVIDDDQEIRDALQVFGLSVKLFASVQEFLDSGDLTRPGCVA